MAFRVEDLGPLAFGGVVEGAKYWDEQRIVQGSLTDKDVMKKAETWAFLGIGGGAAIASGFGLGRRWETWYERVAAGFLYGVPGFLRETVSAMGGGTTGNKLNAVQEAQRILQQTQRASRQLGGGGSTQRSYEREFDSVGVV